MKPHLQDLLQQALVALKTQQLLDDSVTVPSMIAIERARDVQYGDFASNIALQLAKPAKRNPRQLAEQIVAHLPNSERVAKVDIAGPGFINFFMTDEAFQDTIAHVLEQGEQYGCLQIGAEKAVHIEIISANPTGPLHVGHGRLAAYGASLSSLLTVAGYRVHREYYVNDAGRQMDILAVSVWFRYLMAAGVELTFPSNAYQGDYIVTVAEQLTASYGDQFMSDADMVMNDLPADEPDGGDKEVYIDALVQRARELLGEENYHIIHQAGLETILADIREDLAEFGVHFDEWFSERKLTSTHAVEKAIAELEQAGYVYRKDGALWFNAIHFGDEKDRVLIRANGQTTYFASDVAYHSNKLQRGFEHIIDVLGADHHGYVARIKASLAALGKDPCLFTAILVQFAILYRGTERLSMSTRKGSFVTLRSLRDEVGNDAARFFYIQRRADQHMDFDLELAKAQTADNPVYYIQYAHARICSVLRQCEEKNLSWSTSEGIVHRVRLTEAHEKQLLRLLSSYPELIEMAATAKEPHQIAHYLRELANALHTYYNAHQFLVTDEHLRQARLSLIVAVRQVLANGLAILGVSAPEKM